MNKIRKAMFYSIIFKHLLLMNDTVTLSSIIIITRQSFIQSSNAIASIFFSSHAELLSSIPIHSLRSQNITSVILLTANDTDLDIVDGLERGADDYITKPFSLSVLRARVNTQLRKQASNHKNAPFHMDLFHFDFEAMTFYVADSKVELSKTEQKLLRLLVENRGRTMTRGDLVDRVWTDGAEYVDENALSVTIKRLRDKLGAQKYIKTVYGIGYSWVTKDE